MTAEQQQIAHDLEVFTARLLGAAMALDCDPTVRALALVSAAGSLSEAVARESPRARLLIARAWSDVLEAIAAPIPDQPAAPSWPTPAMTD